MTTINININRRRIATRDADWNESDHKRDHGKFAKMAGASGGGSSSGSAKGTRANPHEYAGANTPAGYHKPAPTAAGYHSSYNASGGSGGGEQKEATQWLLRQKGHPQDMGMEAAQKPAPAPAAAPAKRPEPKAFQMARAAAPSLPPAGSTEAAVVRGLPTASPSGDPRHTKAFNSAAQQHHAGQAQKATQGSAQRAQHEYLAKLHGAAATAASKGDVAGAARYSGEAHTMREKWEMPHPSDKLGQTAAPAAPQHNTANVAAALRPDAGKYKHPADQKWMANRLAEVDAALKSPNPVEALSKIRTNPSYSRFTAYRDALIKHHGAGGGGAAPAQARPAAPLAGAGAKPSAHPYTPEQQALLDKAFPKKPSVVEQMLAERAAGPKVGSPEHAKQQSEAAQELARGQRSPIAAGPSAEPAKPFDFNQIVNAWHNTHGSSSTPREHMEGEAKQHIAATVARAPKAAEAFSNAMQSSAQLAEQRKAVVAAMKKLADDSSVPYGPTNNLYKALMTHFKESGAASVTQTRGERISKYLGQKFIGPRSR